MTPNVYLADLRRRAQLRDRESKIEEKQYKKIKNQLNLLTQELKSLQTVVVDPPASPNNPNKPDSVYSSSSTDYPNNPSENSSLGNARQVQGGNTVKSMTTHKTPHPHHNRNHNHTAPSSHVNLKNPSHYRNMFDRIDREVCNPY